MTISRNTLCGLRLPPPLILLLLAATVPSSPRPRVLVLTETGGWDHGTRAASYSAVIDLGKKNGFDVDTASKTDGLFTEAKLASYAAVCFVNTTGTLFTDAEATAFQKYMQAGGGYVGVHASTDAEYQRPWYAGMTGANFNGHPFNIATAKAAVRDKSHLSTSFIAQDTLTLTDEWYFWANNPDFRNNPLIDPATGSGITVLMDLVESSIPGSTLHGYHPICWSKAYGQGRVWYNGLGHSPQTYGDSLFRRMLLGGIQYAAGMAGTGTVSDRVRVASMIEGVSSWSDSRVSYYDLRGRRVLTTAGSRRSNEARIGAGIYCFVPADGAAISGVRFLTVKASMR
jgi:type 1 glutamine amidotransferase